MVINNGSITDEEARFLVGDGANTPPGRTPLPTSEGTLAKGQYRRSDIHDLLTTIAVVNDDGTPISAGLATLLFSLVEIAERLETSINAVAASTSLLMAISETLAKSITVKPEPFDTGWIAITGTVPASIYTTGDVVGNPILFDGLPKSGEITSVVVVDEDKEEIRCDLAVFNETPADVDDHDIFVIAQGEHHKHLGDIPVTNADYVTYSGSSHATVRDADFDFIAPEGRLTVYWVTRGAPTLAAGKLMWVRFLGHSTFKDVAGIEAK